MNTKYVLLAYIGDNRYSVEFMRNGVKRYYRRHASNRWVKRLLDITQLVAFTGGLRVLKADDSLDRMRAERARVQEYISRQSASTLALNGEIYQRLLQQHYQTKPLPNLPERR